MIAAALGPAPTAPERGVSFGAVVFNDDRLSHARIYRAHLERTGPEAVRRLLELAHRRGHVYDQRRIDPDDEPTECAAVLNVVDADGEAIMFLMVPTVDGWSWWQQAAELRHSPTTRPQAPTCNGARAMTDSLLPDHLAVTADRGRGETTAVPVAVAEAGHGTNSQETNR